MDKRTTRQVGQWAESLALEYLQGQGYEVLLQNYGCPEGEIDLIAREGGVLSFVEVRARESEEFGHPLETIDRRKQGRIILAARHFLHEAGGPEGPMRFDALGIVLGPPHHFTLVKEAFEV